MLFQPSARSEARPIDRHSSASFSPISRALLHPFPKLHPKASSIRHSGPLSNNQSALSSVTLPSLFHTFSTVSPTARPGLFPDILRQFPTLPHTAPTPSGRPVLWLFRTPTPHIRTLRLLRSSNRLYRTPALSARTVCIVPLHRLTPRPPPPPAPFPQAQKKSDPKNGSLNLESAPGIRASSHAAAWRSSSCRPCSCA